MNVLSLFDGMSCGQIALNRAGINYDNYFASEIDKHAIKVTQANYPNTVQLGDVTKVSADNLPQIDLLIGGSPCQGFSFAGKQLNFDDPRSKLFFEFVRLLKECKPKYFLLENVVMKQEYQDVISAELGCKPIMINSALVSAQNRKRLYWTNIPDVVQPEDKEIYLRDILDGSGQHKYIPESHLSSVVRKKNYVQYDVNGTGYNSQCHRAHFPDGKQGCLSATGTHNAKVFIDDKIRYNSRYEHEKLQTVPVGYTSVASDLNAKKMIGNGWTVDVVAHIFKGIKPC